MNKRVIRISVLVVVLAALFVAVGTALANVNTLCGSSGAGFTVGPNGLGVKKDVFCSLDRVWNWTIVKSADQSALTLATGEQFPVNYTVTASAVSTGSYFVVGDLNVRNVSGAPITVNSVSDSQGPVVCPVTFPVYSGRRGGYSLRVHQPQPEYTPQHEYRHGGRQQWCVRFRHSPHRLVYRQPGQRPTNVPIFPTPIRVSRRSPSAPMVREPSPTATHGRSARMTSAGITPSRTPPHS